MTSKLYVSRLGTERDTPRIIHVTTAHDPLDIRIFRKQCVSLSRVFEDIHLVAPHEQSFERNGIRIHGVSPHSNRAGRFLGTLRRVFVLARSLRGDVYHLHDPDLLLVAPMLRRSGARVIFDSHEDYPRDLRSRPYLQNRLGSIVVDLYSLFERRIFRSLDAVVTVNGAMTERIRALQPNTVTIYNFPISDELPEPVSVPLSGSRVVWLGLLNSARGVRTLEGAARLLELGSIDVIGRCDDIEIESSPLNYLGRMEYQDALARTSQYAAGLAVFPDTEFHRDMFPIKLFEYMLMGLPLIASGFPKWKGLIKDSDCAIFVDPDDPVEIANAIEWVLRNPAEARQMGARGRRLALDNYDWESEARKLIGLYGVLLGPSVLGQRADEYLPLETTDAEVQL